jgi:putative flippase GtrA
MSDRLPCFEVLRSGIRYGKLVSVGAVGAACETTVRVVLTETFGILPEIASLEGVETTILVIFDINVHWAFAKE